MRSKTRVKRALGPPYSRRKDATCSSTAACCALPICRGWRGRLRPATRTRCRSSRSWRENRGRWRRPGYRPGERRDGSAGAGLRVLPRHAGILAALGQDLAHGGTGDGQVALVRWLRDRLGRGPQRTGIGGGVLLREQVVELVGKAAAAQSERQRERRQAPRRVPSPRRCSITGPPRQSTWRQRHHLDTPQDVRIGSDQTPDLVNDW